MDPVSHGIADIWQVTCRRASSQQTVSGSQVAERGLVPLRSGGGHSLAVRGDSLATVESGLVAGATSPCGPDGKDGLMERKEGHVSAIPTVVPRA